MTIRSRLGGVDRDTLLRGWFLLFLWLFVNLARTGFAPGPGWWLFQHWPRWDVYLFGTALTMLLIYRQHRYAGVVGFLVLAPLAGFCAFRCAGAWNWVLTAAYDAEINFSFSGLTLHARGYALYVTAQALVPVAVLARHLASRHRLMLYGTAENVDLEIDSRRRPGGYYFVTTR